ncbi:MAG: dephospho-CoA kinase, partial [Flavobacteriales bacterium]|nr:dephospho-CoA kinase [Flavobacteriales bacterium]
MPKKVGITGGIGSGKTTVARIFESLGIPVFYSDHEAKQLYSDDQVVKEEVTNEFGSEIYAEGIFQKERLANLVFGNDEKLARLNSIIHPRVRNRFQEWCLYHDDKDYVLQEAAILI